MRSEGDRRDCCIAGGGPAGLMLGYLLARAGLKVTVLEKHADFLRDFRGDTIHPSTMEVMSRLGLLDDFLKLPHQKVPTVAANFGGEELILGDFSHLKVAAPYVAMMPQWDFLNFLAARAAAFPGYDLRMRTEATGLMTDGGQVTGVRVLGPEGVGEIPARLTIAADGRGSVLRQAAGLEVMDLGASIDVLWFRLSRRPGDTDQTQGRFDRGRIFIMLNRGEYWQCAKVIAKGANARIRDAGIAAFRAELRPLLPFSDDRTAEIDDWDQVKLLNVQVNRLKRWWRPGFLAIGDAAHAMSPVGGVGVNLAVQDAVAAANLLTRPLLAGNATDADLASVEKRRLWPTRATQALQVFAQNRVLAPALAATAPRLRAPLAARLVARLPYLNCLPARLIGIGLRPELPDLSLPHVKAP
ncbi:FAD-dependent oxidoreductase [Frigidibacter sp. RF13]|uniref:FAD-dependent oxidoreductase n=1 Tax=Frigidibacter sp. RF13 TaxID=2997340 RepID=UPI00226F17AE|nr:FAD-dependent oxidoreductase [Frigidibacter sp. RF13]MCY1126653.1 FAD-dependent oxidoreductase [Frigidibacter sp. RF13]